MINTLILATFVFTAVYTLAAFIQFAANEINNRRFNAEIDRMELPNITYDLDLSWMIADESELEPDSEDEMESVAIAVDMANYAAMTVSELREVCKEAGIKWRNVNGKNKHLSKDAMIAALA